MFVLVDRLNCETEGVISDFMLLEDFVAVLRIRVILLLP